MRISNFIMAVLIALFYLCYFKSLADAAKALAPDKQGKLIAIMVLKHIFLGVTLNILLVLLGLMHFTFNDIFICVSLIILFQSL